MHPYFQFLDILISAEMRAMWPRRRSIVAVALVIRFPLKKPSRRNQGKKQQKRVQAQCNFLVTRMQNNISDHQMNASMVAGGADNWLVLCRKGKKMGLKVEAAKPTRSSVLKEVKATPPTPQRFPSPSTNRVKNVKAGGMSMASSPLKKPLKVTTAFLLC